MTREEIIENLWGRAVVRNLDIGKGELSEIVDYVIKNYDRNLPEGLDEADVEYQIKTYGNNKTEKMKDNLKDFNGSLMPKHNYDCPSGFVIE